MEYFDPATKHGVLYAFRGGGQLMRLGVRIQESVSNSSELVFLEEVSLKYPP
jgi:hypothetical protein